MQLRLRRDIAERVPETSQSRYVERQSIDRRVAQRLGREGFALALVVAPGGAGKSTWSAMASLRHADAGPVVWCAAPDLSFGEPDPLAVRIMQASYGAPDASRIVELSAVLRRENLRLRVTIDAIDESKDYALLLRCLRTFSSNALAASTLLVLTCRAEALADIERALRPSFPHLFSTDREPTPTREAGPIQVEPLSEKESETLLFRAGAKASEVRDVRSALLPEHSGNPLFLLQALELLRRGTLPSDGSDLMGAIAQRLVGDIQSRLASNGRAPSRQSIERFLGHVALRTLGAPREVLELDEVNGISGTSEEGENTLVSRAVQSGLLEWRGARLVGFAHALFLEHFTAVALAVPTTDWSTWLAELGEASRTAIVQRVARAMTDPAPLVRAVLQRNRAVGAELVASLKLVDEPLAREAVAVAGELFASRFPSDHERAIDILAGVGGPEAVRVAISWFNSIPNEERVGWFTTAADLFLKLECVDALNVILWHRYTNPEFAWFEPSFIRHTQQLSLRFRSAFIASLREQVTKTSNTSVRERSVLWLSVLRDEWLVTYLQARLELGRLSGAEHKALIFLDTEKAILVYAQSAELCLLDMERLRNDGDGAGNQRAEMSYSLVLLGSDVRMHSHAWLLELVGAALESTRRDHRWFACSWAEKLANPVLANSYANAAVHLGRFWGTSMFETLARELTFSELRAIFMTCETAGQQAIVRHMHECPGPATERFLLDRLDVPHLTFYVIQTLGRMGSLRAAPAIHPFLRETRRHLRDVAVTALGRLRYLPAVGEMADLLLRPDEDSNGLSRDGGSDSEYLLIQSLGKIGGQRARDSLISFFVRATHPELIVAALLRMEDRVAIDAAVALLRDRPDAGYLLTRAISSREHDEDMGYPRTAKRIEDERVSEIVLAYARRTLPESKAAQDLLARPVFAVSALTDERAMEYLHELASEVLPLEEGSQHFLSDPRLEARGILAMRGVQPYQRESLEQVLRIHADAQFWSLGSITRALNVFPEDLVREDLLRWINGGRPRDVHFALYVLQSFATAEDRELFQTFENHGDVRIADIAHAYLWRYRSIA